ncbi:MAG: hypothetical protein Q4Q00_12340 [Turicibacter sp.]|nr:hypothetical protein [Turicibacter sp.]
MKKKVFDHYDYENFYDQSFHEQTGELLNEVVKPLRGVAYTTATIKAGNQLEVEIYPSFKKEIPEMIQRFKKNKSRESSEQQKNLNDRNAKKKLMRLIHENFYTGDYWCTFTFKEEPQDLETTEKLCHNFFRRINRARKKKGLKNAKYVYVIEEGTTGTERFHLHLIMDNGLTKEEVESKWKLGASTIRTLNYYKEENFIGVCKYMMKDEETYKRTAFRLKGKRRWGSSKGNLVLPKPSKNRTKMSKRKVIDMVLNQDSIGETLEREYPMYQFKEVEIRYSDWNGLFYIYARMQDRRMRVRR